MSSTKRVVHNHHIIVNGDMAGSITSDVIDAGSLDHLGVEFAWSGTSPVGAMNLEGSVTGDVWIPIVSSVAVTGSTGSNFIKTGLLEQVQPFPKIRVRYARTSGSGTLNAYLGAKEN